MNINCTSGMLHGAASTAPVACLMGPPSAAQLNCLTRQYLLTSVKRVVLMPTDDELLQGSFHNTHFQRHSQIQRPAQCTGPGGAVLSPARRYVQAATSSSVLGNPQAANTSPRWANLRATLDHKVAVARSMRDRYPNHTHAHMPKCLQPSAARQLFMLASAK